MPSKPANWPLTGRKGARDPGCSPAGIWATASAATTSNDNRPSLSIGHTAGPGDPVRPRKQPTTKKNSPGSTPMFLEKVAQKKVAMSLEQERAIGSRGNCRGAGQPARAARYHPPACPPAAWLPACCALQAGSDLLPRRPGPDGFAWASGSRPRLLDRSTSRLVRCIQHERAGYTLPLSRSRSMGARTDCSRPAVAGQCSMKSTGTSAEECSGALYRSQGIRRHGSSVEKKLGAIDKQIGRASGGRGGPCLKPAPLRRPCRRAPPLPPSARRRHRRYCC
jgi:hypothetical protein